MDSEAAAPPGARARSAPTHARLGPRVNVAWRGVAWPPRQQLHEALLCSRPSSTSDETLLPAAARAAAGRMRVPSKPIRNCTDV